MARTLLMVLLVAFVATCTVQAAGHHKKSTGFKEYYKCPVTGKPACAKYKARHGGHTIYFCSSKCYAKFRRAPYKYIKNLYGQDEKAKGKGNVCPVTGKKGKCKRDKDCKKCKKPCKGKCKGKCKGTCKGKDCKCKGDCKGKCNIKDCKCKGKCDGKNCKCKGKCKCKDKCKGNCKFRKSCKRCKKAKCDPDKCKCKCHKACKKHKKGCECKMCKKHKMHRCHCVKTDCSKNGRCRCKGKCNTLCECKCKDKKEVCPVTGKSGKCPKAGK